MSGGHNEVSHLKGTASLSLLTSGLICHGSTSSFSFNPETANFATKEMHKRLFITSRRLYV